jgi:hypothetical protein
MVRLPRVRAVLNERDGLIFKLAKYSLELRGQELVPNAGRLLCGTCVSEGTGAFADLHSQMSLTVQPFM